VAAVKLGRGVCLHQLVVMWCSRHCLDFGYECGSTCQVMLAQGVLVLDSIWCLPGLVLSDAHPVQVHVLQCGQGQQSGADWAVVEGSMEVESQ